MKSLIEDYLYYLDKVLDGIPKIDRVCLEEITKTSYSLIYSKDVLCDIQYLDYLICYMFDERYISYDMFLNLGNYLEKIINGLKITK